MNNGNNPAYATEPLKRDNLSDSNNVFEYCKGLTKREYFAGLAMQGILAASHSDAESSAGFYTPDPNHIAKLSVSYADKLLKELETPRATSK